MGLDRVGISVDVPVKWLLELPAPLDALPACDVVFHLATHPRSQSFADPLTNISTNVSGIISVIEYAIRHGAHIIYTSNSGICGQPRYLPIDESHPISPSTPYDVTKLAAEHMLAAFDSSHTTLRLGTVYGPGQEVREKWRPVIPALIADLTAGVPPTISGGDVVEALLLAADRQPTGTYMIGSGTETSINAVCQLLSRMMLGHAATPVYGPSCPGEIRRMCLCITQAREALGWQPRVEFRDGLWTCLLRSCIQSPT